MIPASEMTLGTAIAKGVSAAKLALMFGMSVEAVRKKLAKNDVPMSGRLNGSDLYLIKDAAPFLVTPVGNLEDILKNLTSDDLPPKLQKDFWTAQKAKQQVQLEAGDLWPTDKVVAEVGELMKIMKMNTLLMIDAVERQSELSDRQREIIKSLTHGMLEDLVKRIEEKFTEPEPAGNVQRQESEDL